MHKFNRRTFLQSTAAAGSLTVAGRSLAAGANSDVTFALMGANNRGSQLAERFLKFPGVKFAYVCDPDELALAKGIGVIEAQGGKKPKGVKDFRVALDDPSVDALICAAPNHWHAAATVAACAAGKDVYVEKPCTQTAEEGQVLLDAQKRFGRVVQVGTQRRSSPMYREVVQRVHEGLIGEVLYARTWYQRDRPPVYLKAPSSPPATLDFTLWQGPAPDRPYQENLMPYHWHSFWHWGNAEIGNNGVHTIDICRWALGAELPSRVTCAAQKLRYDDDQQTPDTTTAVFECGKKTIVWEGLSWTPPYSTGGSVGIELRGAEGTVVISDKGYEVYDASRKRIDTQKGNTGDDEHCTNFLDAVRSGASVNASLLDGHHSAMYCHLGNIACRTGQPLDIEAGAGRVLGNADAMKLWGREYRTGFSPTALGGL